MIVLDASALVDAVLDQPSAPWVVEHVAADEVSAPGHQPAEVLSALARILRGGEIDEVMCSAALDAALSLPQHLLPVTPDLVRRAFHLRDRLRVVDGLYVALAERLGCPLVTTDLRLARASLPCEVLTPPR